MPAPYSEPPSADIDVRSKAGWDKIERTMYVDKSHPEVGFCELGPDTRVAGAGETFRGGIDTPGDSTEPQTRGDKKKGVIAGL